MAVKYYLIYFVIFLNTHFGLGSKEDFRFISYQDLLPSVKFYSDSPGTFRYSQLLFDDSMNHLFIGARDVLYRFDLNSLKLLEKAIWEAPSNKTGLCKLKGQTEQNCHNFIKVLLLYGKKLFTCGTNAFSPQCSWRKVEKLSEVIRWVDGIAKCPHNPNANITALISGLGDYYVGGPTDFSGSDTAIYRSNLEYERSLALRTNQYNSKWLDDPQFVGSFETNHFVYIVFRENAIEYTNNGKVIYSRIARVCKNDAGGQLIQRDNWSTFIKARLNCSLSGEYPFYYNEIQSMYYIEEENLMYATFSTPTNSIMGSAICAFNLSAIDSAFNGPFKYQETPNSLWEKHKSQHQHHFECRGTSTRSNQFMDSSRFQLMYNAVQPVSINPLHETKLERYNHIVVDVLDTKFYKSVHVLYVTTDEGLIKKITVLPRTQATCIVEIWSVIPSNTPIRIRSMRNLRDVHSIYVTTDDSLMKIDTQHCSRHVSKNSCLNSMDPYCGWNELQEACTPAPDGNPLARFWLQSVTSCPILNTPVDGGWSSWSDWFSCDQKSTNDSNSTDQCLCQSRQCNNPSPQNGGKSCQGVSITVTNCTVHGGWTAWSAWSDCSASCGLAYKSRFRTCGNPSPAHGGRVCVGRDSDQIHCIHNPPCSESRPPPRDGGWSPWGPWEDCSVSCGGGFKVKRRKCDNPSPLNGGLECRGSHIEYEMCNTDSCPEFKKFGPWSKWMIANGSYSNTSNGYIEKRFRCSCRAQTSHHSLIKIAIAKEEERYCRYDGNCNTPSAQKWSTWSPWTECSVKCGGGYQSRSRTCEGTADECIGPTYMSRSCNYHSCHGKWSCWSEWTPCSVTCGVGTQQRSRVCLSKNKESQEGNCNGPSQQERSCDMPECAYGVAAENVSISTGVVLAYCLAGFIVGLAFACFIFFFYIRTKKPSIPSSPHYLPSKQNLYKTIPLQEMPSKRPTYSSTSERERNNSFIMNNTNTSTLKHHNKAVSDYESSTIKRNSNSNYNGHMRSDNDLLDKYY